MGILFLVFVLLIIVVLLLDIIPSVNTWQSRIHIGRWNEIKVWKDKVEYKSLQWLRKTPVIKLTDNSRLIIIDIIKGNYHRNEIQHWQEAALLLGLSESYRVSKNEKILKEINEYLNKHIDDSGKLKNNAKHVDVAILAYAIINMDWLNHEKYTGLYKEVYELINKHIDEDGTVMYRKHMKNYRYVDTIGFISPFLVSYGIKFNDKRALELGVNQIVEFNKYGLFQDTFIPCHTYNITTKIPSGLLGWGRGLGWYAIGLIDAWNELPNNYERKEELTQVLINFSKMAIKSQNQNGSWSWLVTSEESQPDSSTTSTLGWLLINAAKIKEIEKECLEASNKAASYLKSVTKRCGAVDLSQGDTKGIGIHSQEFGILPFTQGFCLRLLNHIK